MCMRGVTVCLLFVVAVGLGASVHLVPLFIILCCLWLALRASSESCYLQLFQLSTATLEPANAMVQRGSCRQSTVSSWSFRDSRMAQWGKQAWHHESNPWIHAKGSSTQVGYGDHSVRKPTILPSLPVSPAAGGAEI